MTESKRANTGFTVVELIVVLIVIALLVVMSVVSYGAWRTSVTEKVLMSDLNGLKGAMDSARTFDNGYPTTLPARFEASQDVTLNYRYGTSTAYCVEATSTKAPGKQFYLSTYPGGGEPTAGVCPAQPSSITKPAIPKQVDVTVQGSTAQVTWAPVAGATGYDVRYRVSMGAWTQVAATAPTQTVTGMTLLTQYDYEVRAKNSAGESDWSATKYRTALPAPVITTVGTPACGAVSGGQSWMDVDIWWTGTAYGYHVPLYMVVGTEGVAYGQSPVTVQNSPTNTLSTFMARASTTRWPSNTASSGSIAIYAIGSNGERSSPTTWTSPTYAPHTCS